MQTGDCANQISSPTEEVIINILERLQPFHGMLHKVKKLVLSPLGELVCYVVPKRRRIRCGGVLVALHTIGFDSPFHIC